MPGEFNEAAVNGLQVEGDDEVERVAIAVDACQHTIDAAVDAGATMLIVHHGLFWGREQPLTGPHGRRVRSLVKGGLNLYASHLPLDANEAHGNNSELGRLLGLEEMVPFGSYRGTPIGWGGRAAPRTLDEIGALLERKLGFTPKLFAFGPEKVERIAMVSGGGSSSIGEAISEGYDLLITGEAPHYAFFDAEEGGVNLALAGHYASETLGVKALGRAIEAKFGLPVTFIDHPTGL